MVNSLDLKEHFNGFKKLFFTKYPSLNDKKYFYLNIWSIGCKPCLDEFETVIKIIELISYKANCVFVTHHSNNAVTSFLNKNFLGLNECCFINDVPFLIKEIYKELKINVHLLPLHVVLNLDGSIIAILKGSIQKTEDASGLIAFTRQLP